MASLQEMLKRKKAEIAASSGRREKTVKPKPGKNRFRILPSWRGENEQFYHEFGQHFIKDEKKNLKAVYICVSKTFKKPCPICDGIAMGINSTANDDIKNALAESKSSERILMNALHLDGEDPNTPVILELSPTTFDKLLDIAIENADPQNENFNIVTDTKSGVDIVINRSGTGLNTEYSVQPALKGSKPVSDAILEKMHDLDKYVKQEYEEGKNKAISAISSVSGVLPAPSSSSSSFANNDDNAFDEDVPDFSSNDSIDDVEYKKVDEDDTSMSDDELNSLLNELE